MTRLQIFGTKLLAIIEIISARTFTLSSSKSKPGDFNQVTFFTDIREIDYKKE